MLASSVLSRMGAVSVRIFASMHMVLATENRIISSQKKREDCVGRRFKKAATDGIQDDMEAGSRLTSISPSIKPSSVCINKYL